MIGLFGAILFVPETLSPQASQLAVLRRNEFVLGHKNRNNKFLMMIFRPIHELSIVNRDSFFRLLSSLAFFSGMATYGDRVLLLYYVDSVLSFSSMDIALMFLVVGMSAVTAQAILLKPLNNFIGERWLLMVCFAAAMTSNSLYGLSTSRKTLYIGVCVGALGSMAFPTISAIKANNVDQSEQGRIQGALYSIQAAAGGIGPMAMRGVDLIAKMVGLKSGTMFFFAAFLQFLALCCAFQLPKDKTNSKIKCSNVQQSLNDTLEEVQCQDL
jgi:DHA1 family tetracycline resistance protein-like MFS transporter